jgi:pimeloyl-ACP methyl ester carboxylesterase
MHVPWYIGWPIVIGFGFGIFFMVASRAPYYPIKYPSGFWELQSKLSAEDVWLLTADGVRLHAWWVRAPRASLVTLYLHGNAGNLTYRFLPIREIIAAGSSVLMLDYRGYGRSAGSPSEHGLYADADAAYLYLLNNGYRAKHIVLQGESLGTAVAVNLASRKECAGVVLEAAFTSGGDVANTVLPVIGPLVFWGFDSKSKIAKIRW